MHLAVDGEDTLSPARMGSVVNALTDFVDNKLEQSNELQDGQDDSVIALSYAKGKNHARTVLVKLMDLGAVSPLELGVQSHKESEEALQGKLLDQAISAATEVLHYISGAGLTPQTVMRAKVTGARPFRKLVKKSCLEAPDAFQCRKQKSEELLCAMAKVAGSKLMTVQVELAATAAGKTCQLSGGYYSSDLPAKVRAQLPEASAAAALSQEGARTELAAGSTLEAVSQSEQELKPTDASQAGFGVMHGLQRPKADEEWVQVDNLVRGMLKLLEEKDEPEEWPSRVL